MLVFYVILVLVVSMRLYKDGMNVCMSEVDIILWLIYRVYCVLIVIILFVVIRWLLVVISG